MYERPDEFMDLPQQLAAVKDHNIKSVSDLCIEFFIQGDSVARVHNLLSIKLCYWDNDFIIYIHLPGTM